MRRSTVAMLAAVVAGACGGGGSPSTPTTAVSSSAPATDIVQLDATNFDALVLAGDRPSLVEFHSPT